jgi:NAD(P)-dependent dehydrogenase (short-subunit alcohol dehydrogenase family)
MSLSGCVVAVYARRATMAGQLDGQVALVTGAGRGIGRGVALLLAEQGAAVVVADAGVNLDGSGHDEGPAAQVVREITAAGGKAVASTDSVAEFEGGRRMVRTALDNYGRLDILCHVAGILRDRMVFNMMPEEWDAVLAVHLKGAFNTVRHAVEPMMAQRYGRILLFSSGSGLGSSGQANYSAAKEGMVGFSRALARELGPFGINVNAIYPGGATRMTASVPTTARERRAAAGIVGGGQLAVGQNLRRLSRQCRPMGPTVRETRSTTPPRSCSSAPRRERTSPAR